MPSAQQRKDALATAVEAIGPLLDAVAEMGPVPDAFWADTYVIGYLAGVGGSAVEEATGGALSEKDTSEAAFEAVAEVSGRESAAIWLLVQDAEGVLDENFEAGFDAAALVMAVAWGVPDVEEEDLVKEARAFVAANAADLDAEGAPPDPTDRAVLALQTMLFFGYVQNQFYAPDTGAG